MAVKFLTNIDLNRNQLLNASFQVLATPPGNAFEGQMYFDSGLDSIQVYSGSTWKTHISSIVSGGSYSAALSTNESNGEVTLTLNLASGSIAGLMTAADFTKLADATEEATPGKLVIRNGSGNISVATPTQTAHAATKGYVDGARQGLDVKASVRAISTTNITLSGEQEIDGVNVVDGDRVLVVGQTGSITNGIYDVAAGAWSRSDDADSSADVTTGMFTFVSEGTIYADSGWVLTTNDAIVLNTTALSFTQNSGAGQSIAGNGLTKDGNSIDVVGTADRITVNADSVDIASTYVGQSSITTLGTITTGVWTGTDVAVADGGTGAGTASDARTNLGVAIGSDVQAYDAELAAVAGLVSAADRLPYFTGSGTASLATFTAAGRALVDDADADAQRTTLGLVIGTNVQAWDTELDAIASVTSAADKLPYFTGLGTAAVADFTAAGRALVDDASNADMRNTLAETSATSLTTSTPRIARIAQQGSAADIGGTSTTTVTHNFGTTSVVVQVFQVSTGETVITDVTRSSSNALSVVILGEVDLNAYMIVVTG